MEQFIYRLPRLVEADPRGENLLEQLRAHSQPLREGGAVNAPIADLDENLVAVIKAAYQSGNVVRGSEGAERALAAEARGLAMVDKKSGVVRGGRVSRLLLLANDGSDLFYKQIEKLLATHGARVMAIRLTVDAGTLGAPLFGSGKTTRVLMLEHKAAVAAALLAIADQFSPDA